ncbi:MAG: inner membrane protein YebZ [Pseudomonadota bacterium]
MSLALLCWQTAALMLVGGGLFLLRAGPEAGALAFRRPVLPTLWAVLAALAWPAGVLVFLDEAARIFGRAPALSDPLLRVLLLDTRFGQVWAAKQLLLTLLLIGLLWYRRRPHPQALRVGVVLAGLFLLVGLWAGHGGATPPVALSMLLHGAHGLAAAAWLGGLPCWIFLLRCAPQDVPGNGMLTYATRRFSSFAGGMMLLLVASGVLVAARQFENWPAVFGTPAGGLLLAKLTMLLMALGCAWHLRERYLPALDGPSGPALRRAALRVVSVEIVAAMGVFALGLALSRTTPGAHAAVDWPLPFRIAPEAAWTDAPSHWPIVAGVGVLLMALPALWARRPRIALCCLLLGGGATAHLLSVPAFPETYRQPDVTYTARSITRGRAHFTAHCAACHGPGARGQEPQQVGGAQAVILAPDLSEHTALHTAGDMFWWLTHGMPSGAMPGFAAVLDDSARWDLVNFLRAFADGHRARVLSPRIAPARPWLAAPNFQYETSRGEASELREHREQRAVLLVLADLEDSMPRLKDLQGRAAGKPLAGLEILLVLRTGTCDEAAAVDIRLPCVTLGREAIDASYALMARTLSEPGERSVLNPVFTHAEFLIDRFGFLRARWIADREEATWKGDLLAEQVALLAAEPKILESPDEHVH